MENDLLNTKQQVVDMLVNTFPELKNDVDESLKEYSDIYLHLIFGDIFNEFLIDNKKNLNINQMFCAKVSNLINQMMLSPTEEIQEVVVTTVLERLCDNKDVLRILYPHFSDSTKQALEIVQNDLY